MKNSSIDNYVETEYIYNLTKRSIWYLTSGFPIHLRGPAGVGKTSLAFHIAKKLNRPVIFMSGSQELTKADLLGEYVGFKNTLKIDNYISSVYKREEENKKMWKDGHLVRACKNGYTIIYDEFTRTSPQVNNLLLSILEKKVIEIPNGTKKDSVIKVHPDFKMIFTSNPSEYVGVYNSANALIDRMITIDMHTVDRETEKSIITAKTDLSSKSALKIIDITDKIRDIMKDSQFVSVRCSIMLASIISNQNIKLENSEELRSICFDIYGSPLSTYGLSITEREKLYRVITDAIESVLS